MTGDHRPPMRPGSQPAGVLLRAEGLRAAYHTGATASLVAVDDVSIEIREGEVVGVAGESGCGKSTLGAVLSLTARPPLSVLGGTLDVDGVRVNLRGGHDGGVPPRTWRGEVVSLLPQGAMNALNPTVRIRDFAYHVIRAHVQGVSRSEAVARVQHRLTQLDLPPRVLDYYPHQLSGGMKQRVVAAISTLLNPRLLIADEPTSALDVSSQRVLVDMLRGMLADRIITGVLFITHDLPLLRTVADRIAIMYAGKIVEIGPTQEVIERPRHPYSAALLASVLVPEPTTRHRRVSGIPGAPPDLAHPPPGCRFHPRCPLVMELCREEEPPRSGTDLRFSACWWAEQHPGEPVRLP